MTSTTQHYECKTKKIAIAGGIGSGKSVVSRIVEVLGYPVYDCDSRAKHIMDSDRRMIAEIGEQIGSESVNSDGTLNRKALSDIVFADPGKLSMLNHMVHGAVKADLEDWFLQNHDTTCFVETAILYQSGIDHMVDEVWQVEAPVELRIQRVMARNGLQREQVEARISSQCYIPQQPHPHHFEIYNDDQHSLLLQVHGLLM